VKFFQHFLLLLVVDFATARNTIERTDGIRTSFVFGQTIGSLRLDFNHPICCYATAAFHRNEKFSSEAKREDFSISLKSRRKKKKKKTC